MRSSGNRAFDEYRDETLRRLEEEQREFKEFLDRLRHAKDKAEFDQFMAEMRSRRPSRWRTRAAAAGLRAAIIPLLCRGTEPGMALLELPAALE